MKKQRINKKDNNRNYLNSISNNNYCVITISSSKY